MGSDTRSLLVAPRLSLPTVRWAELATLPLPASARSERSPRRWVASFAFLRTLAMVIMDLFSFLGVRSAWKARDLRGLLFPFLDMFHVGFWVAGALYALFQGGSIRPAVANALVGLR